MRKFFVLVLSFLFVVATALCAVVAFFRIEGTPPAVEVADPPEVIGREYALTAEATDGRSGVRETSVALVQKGKVAVLGTQRNPVTTWWRGSSVRRQDVHTVVRPLDLGLAEGDAILQVKARDASWRNSLEGNEGVWEKAIRIDVTPPRISVLSTVHNLSQGGSGLVAYRLNEPASKTGVLIDDIFFPGYPRPDGPEGTYCSLIAVPFDVQAPRQVLVEAADAAGNLARMGLSYRIRPKKHKIDLVALSDQFLQQKMPDLMTRYPQLKGSLLEVFLQVNRDIRRLNNEEMHRVCMKSSPTILWKEAFLRMPRAATRAGFADERHYSYGGKEVDRSFHMGIDLASLSGAPVKSSNSGRVVFADYLGIYGNTVMLDHGLGLCSTYSHLSDIHVAVGDTVSRDQILGTSGTTGLAGGDHLHFGMAINGVFVDPVEWWDPHWIQDHILANLASQ